MLTEPAAVATRAIERALGPDIPHIGQDLGLDKKVLVMGAGPIGQLVIAVLAHIGTDKIIATDLSAFRLRLAQDMGPHNLLNVGDTSLEERQAILSDLCDGVGPDIVTRDRRRAGSLSGVVGISVARRSRRRGRTLHRSGCHRDTPTHCLLQGSRYPRHVGLAGDAA